MSEYIKPTAITDSTRKIKVSLRTTDQGIILNDGTTDFLLLGEFPDGTPGLIIVKSGVDITDVFS